MPDERPNPFYARETTDLPIDADSAELWSVDERVIGTHIGERYHVRRIIGTGGMGTVFEAQQQNPRRVVALKIMRGGVTSPASLRRFTQEAQILARLRHPGIAEVYDAGIHQTAAGEVPYFVMEYIPEARRIVEYAEHHQLPVRDRLELFAKVCDAVEHGHQRGIIHRDLKPGNILINSEGQPKIIDFGVARTTDSDLAATTLQTDVGQLIGTLQYMSPEQYDGDPHAIDGRSDVYALGVVLYELLCGRLPYEFRNANVAEAARIIREELPVRPSSVTRLVRGDLETIILKALNKDRARRYASAAGLRDDILNYLNERPIIARPDSLPYIAGKSLQRSLHRHPLEWSIVAAIAALLVTHFVAVPAIFEWTHVGHRVDDAMREMVAPAADTPLEFVRVIAMSDATDFDAIAAQSGLDNVATATSNQRLRALHGALFKRLTQSRARVVTVDIHFPRESPFDAQLVEGVQALREQGIPTVVAIRQWRSVGEIDAQMSPALMPHVHWGGVTFSKSWPWRLQLAIQKDQAAPIPSLALITLAAFRRPEVNGAVVEFNIETESVALRFWNTHPTIAGQRIDVPPSMNVPVTAIQPHPAGDDSDEFNLLEGDFVAYHELTMPNDEALRASTISYEDVFNADAAQLSEWFAGRVALLGDFRNKRDYYRYGETDRIICGVYAHAVGLDGLLREATVRVPTGYQPFLILMAAAALGLVCGTVLSRSTVMRLLVMAGIICAGLLVCLWVYRVSEFRCNPLPPALVFVLASELVAWVKRTRSIHTPPSHPEPWGSSQ